MISALLFIAIIILTLMNICLYSMNCKSNYELKDLRDFLSQTDKDLTVVTEMVNVLSAQNSRLFQIIQSHNSEANP